MRLVDPVVDDRDLDAFTARTGEPCELRGADERGPRFVDIVYVRLGYTLSAIPSSRSSGSCSYGRLTANPFSTTR